MGELDNIHVLETYDYLCDGACTFGVHKIAKTFSNGKLKMIVYKCNKDV